VVGGGAAAQGSQVVKAAVCKTVYRWFDSIPWDQPRIGVVSGFPPRRRDAG
jgi:hypothetical protein